MPMTHSCNRKWLRAQWLRRPRHYSRASLAYIRGSSTTASLSTPRKLMSSIFPPVKALATSSSLEASGVTIQPAAVVKRLRVLMDQRLSFDQRIDEIRKTYYKPRLKCYCRSFFSTFCSNNWEKWPPSCRDCLPIKTSPFKPLT
jgi:hypothetical protein